MRKLERDFRTAQVWPFLKSLENSHFEPIQQKSIRATADYIGCVRSLFVWLEIKREDGTLEPLQEYKASLISNKAQGISIVVDPTNWKEIKIFLLTLDGGILDSYKLRDIKQSSIQSSIRKTSGRANARSKSVADKAPK